MPILHAERYPGIRFEATPRAIEYRHHQGVEPQADTSAQAYQEATPADAWQIQGRQHAGRQLG